MRILLLTHLYLPTLGGVQRSVHNLARHLVDRGHDVSIATHRPGGFLVSHARDGAAPVLCMNVPDPFTFNPLATARRYALDAVNVATLLRWCRSRGVEIIHSHLINVDTRYAMSVARMTGAKTVVTLRGGETEHWLDANPRRARYVRDILERADVVTAVSRSLLRKARMLVPEVAKKSCVVPNPVTVRFLTELADKGAAVLKRSTPYLLFVGRLEAMKDVEVLIDAFAFACATPSFRHALVIAGSGSLRAELVQRARRIAGERVSFVGSTSYADTLRLVRDAELLVLPSKSSEGCPNCVLEAMALGTPVVVSDLESLRELVDEGRAGAIFPRGDARALADRFLELTGDPAERVGYSRAARARLEAHHAVDDVVARYEEVYERVARRGSAASKAS